MTELMRSPEDLRRVQQEVMDVVGLHRSVEDNDFDKLSYFISCIKETLRLQPSIPVLLQEMAQESWNYSVSMDLKVWYSGFLFSRYVIFVLCFYNFFCLIVTLRWQASVLINRTMSLQSVP